MDIEYVQFGIESFKKDLKGSYSLRIYFPYSTNQRKSFLLIHKKQKMIKICDIRVLFLYLALWFIVH